MREGGCGGVAVGGGRSLLGAAAGVDAGFHVVGGQDFKRGAEGGFREAVGVHGEEERAGVALAGAVLDDGLGDGEDVVLVEGGVEGGAAVAAGAEADFLVGVAGVGVQGVVGGQEAREVDEGVEAGEFAGLVGGAGLGWCGLDAHGAVCSCGVLRQRFVGGCDAGKSP